MNMPWHPCIYAYITVPLHDVFVMQSKMPAFVSTASKRHFSAIQPTNQQTSQSVSQSLNTI